MPAERMRGSHHDAYDATTITEPMTSNGSIAFASNVTPGTFNDPMAPLVDAPCESFPFPPAEDGPIPKQSGHSRKKPENHIPRPPNAFILFRSSFIKSQLYASSEVETNHSTLSKIIGLTWKNLPNEERQIWHAKAKAALEEYKRKYPQYGSKPLHGDPEVDPGDPGGEDQVYTTRTESRARQPASTFQRHTEDSPTPGPSVYANGALAGASNIVMNSPNLTDITYNGPTDAVSVGMAVKMASLSAIAAASITANVALYRELRREQPISGTSKAEISSSSTAPSDSCSKVGDPSNSLQNQYAYTTLSGVVNMLSGGQPQSCFQINGTGGTTQHFLGGFAHLDVASVGVGPPMESTFTLLMCMTNFKFKFRKTRKTVQASSVVL